MANCWVWTSVAPWRSPTASLSPTETPKTKKSLKKVREKGLIMRIWARDLLCWCFHFLKKNPLRSIRFPWWDVFVKSMLTTTPLDGTNPRILDLSWTNPWSIPNTNIRFVFVHHQEISRSSSYKILVKTIGCHSKMCRCHLWPPQNCSWSSVTEGFVSLLFWGFLCQMDFCWLKTNLISLPSHRGLHGALQELWLHGRKVSVSEYGFASRNLRVRFL